MKKNISFSGCNISAKKRASGIMKFMALLFVISMCSIVSAASEKGSLKTDGSSTTTQESKEVRGIVTDESGEAIPGVNVIIKGTTEGTITDINGEYLLSNVPNDAVLLFSFVGMESQEVVVGGKSILNIILKSSAIGLDEIVAIGYGTANRKEVTGSIASVKSDNFADALPMAPDQILQGKVAGVNIVQASGSPGAASTVRIRGSSSISAGNDPLYVVDGVPMQFGSANNSVSLGASGGTTPLSSDVSNPLNIINPSDIESIDILKDASATAIYGSRGANGVIIITTKNKGRSNEFVSYDGFMGISYVPENLPFLSASEYRKFAEDNDLAYPDEGANTNWQDQIFRTAITQNHNLSMAGGSENSNFRASFGYSDEEGVILSSGLTKYTSRLNGMHKALEGKLQIDINMSYSHIDEDKTPISSSIGNEGGNILKDGLRWAPTLPVYNEDGSYYQIGELRINPVSWVEVLDETKTDVFLGNISFGYDIFDFLKYNLDLGVSNEYTNRYTCIPDTHPAGETEGGRASISKFQNSSVIAETNFTFDKDISDHSHITALVGYSYQRFQNENTYTQANQFVSTVTKWNLMQSGTILANTSFKEANRLASYYGRINYKLKNKYLLTFTLRRDGSSKFGGNNKWGTFPSAALAWNIADEEFLTGTQVSNLKLRLGLGVTGNQEIPNYLYMEQLGITGSSTYYLNGSAVPAVLPTNYANEDLQWEETKQTNIGVDFGFFAERISGSIDYYSKRTTDLLLSFSTAAPSVVSTQWANVGEVTNKGIEVNLSGVVVDGSDFTWRTNINFATNKNNVESLSNETFKRDEIRTTNGSGVVANNNNIKIIIPGEPLGTFIGRKFTGLDENGMETYLDGDGDGTADEVVIGHVDPDFTFGFNNNFKYKNFDAAINIRGVVGNDIYNNTEAEFSYPSTAPGVNVLRSALTSGTSMDQTSEFSSRWIQDGSYLRVDNVSIGYTIDVSKIDFIKKARVYVSGKNLLVITNYSGFDPEVNTRSSGIDYLSYPRPRTFMVGASLSF
ncbi:SusC/RagA family TonB-linked outer membrane protein [Plebeiibacterium marinum]|uniref:TonB-dependent receptor n=1 Tax=Plebeiibacterium marinum TaxID=2992111 RepID=A0AAE3MD97_9BACT|nr:TonB-dependent receptor [Plebeiobacterium marinum]MCW3805485.1 TonB-dependent receptor [Plebeiobacterium marinum]